MLSEVTINMFILGQVKPGGAMNLENIKFLFSWLK